MNFQGLDYGTALGSYAKSLEQGYRDTLALKQYQDQQAHLVNQDAIASQQADFMYPKEDVLSERAMQANAASPFDVIQGAANSANQVRPAQQVWSDAYTDSKHVYHPAALIQGPPPAIPNVFGPGYAPQGLQQQTAPVITQPIIPGQPAPNQFAQVDRDPAGGRTAISPPLSNPELPPHAPENAPMSDEDKQKMAQSFGLTYEDGQFKGPGNRVKAMRETYDKLLGVAGQVYANLARPQPGLQLANTRQPPPDRLPARPAKAASDPMASVYKVAKAAVVRQDASGMPATGMAAVNYFRNVKIVNDYEKSQMGRKPQSVDDANQSSTASSRKGFSPSQNSTYIFDADGNVVGVENGDTRGSP